MSNLFMAIGMYYFILSLYMRLLHAEVISGHWLFSFILLPLIPPWEGLSLCQNFNTSFRLNAQWALGIGLFQFIGTQSWVWLFAYMLGIQTQILMFERQIFYPKKSSQALKIVYIWSELSLIIFIQHIQI